MLTALVVCYLSLFSRIILINSQVQKANYCPLVLPEFAALCITAYKVVCNDISEKQEHKQTGTTLQVNSPSSQDLVSSWKTTMGRQKKMSTKSQTAKLANSELEMLFM
ncbi:hypothetical protein EYF80_056605 [Liparis tanakae]|uniref:Secreted protein n=1 Tax=Liparis tanakae TaxID=230148 RepID=A0A4Z2EYF0_9TELE|nr:hypothetical protein EYF80_056605 [Liparis tanakae]